MKNRMMIAGLMLAALGSITSLAAADNSPVGVWKTIDDTSGKAKSLIRITEAGGILSGTVEKLFREPQENQNPLCDKCEGALKDQPIIGMTILSGLKQEGDSYTGGQIIDPASGKVYKSKLSLTDNGEKLNVRGYIGLPMLGRTQTWLRAQ